jgi:putative transposase
VPHNKLSEKERQQILQICNTSEYADMTPNFIVPDLADKGIYIASESTFYRVLKESHQLTSRARAKPRNSAKRPYAQCAKAPNSVWTWDISYMPSTVKGRHFYLYMITDIFSRKIVGAEVYEQELGDYAAQLLQKTLWKERCLQSSVVLHSDNGSPMRSFTMVAKMQELGVISSYSRPRVSNDNPYSEALFRTVKYHRTWPIKGFSTINEARSWVFHFCNWYNHEHKHSGIKFVTPHERHSGMDAEILDRRVDVYQNARKRNPERWSQNTRNWEFITAVFLNPEKEVA